MHRIFLVVVIALIAGTLHSSSSFSSPLKTEQIDLTDTYIKTSNEVYTTQFVYNEVILPTDVSQQEPFNSQTINGISLHDDKATVVKKLGIPIHIVQDEFTPEMEQYEYHDMQILFIGNNIQSIAVPASENQVILGDRIISTDPYLMKETFGEPHLESMDGILYKTDSLFIKVFFIPGTSDFDSIHFFTQGV